MKKVGKIFITFIAVIMLVSVFACKEPEKSIYPKDKSVNMFSSTNLENFYNYQNNYLRFVAKELYIANDYSGYVQYKVADLSTSESNIKDFETKVPLIKVVVDKLNKDIYSTSAYEAGYRFFTQNDSDFFEIDGDTYTRIRFLNFNYLSQSQAKIVTLGEILQSETSSNKFYDFVNVKTSKRENIKDSSDKVKQHYKILKITNFFNKNYTDDFKITLQSKPLCYYNGQDSVNNNANFLATKTTSHSLVVTRPEEIYIMFDNSSFVMSPNTWVLIFGSVAILAFVVMIIIKFKPKRRKV